MDKKKNSQEILAQVKAAKQKQAGTNLNKIVGKKKNKDRFGKVNFSG